MHPSFESLAHFLVKILHCGWRFYRMWRFRALCMCFHADRWVCKWPDCIDSRRLFLQKDSWYQRHLLTRWVTRCSIFCNSRDLCMSDYIYHILWPCICSQWDNISYFSFTFVTLDQPAAFLSSCCLSVTLLYDQNTSDSQTNPSPLNGGQTDWWSPTANRPIRTDCHMKYDCRVNVWHISFLVYL